MYRFKSRTTGDLLMHDAVGKQILDLLGKNPDAAGVLIWQDMAQARRLLMEAAQAQELKSDAEDAVDDAWDSAKSEHGIHLAQRIVPFLEVLKRCEAAQVDLVWGG